MGDLVQSIGTVAINVKYWTQSNSCVIRSSDCQSSNVRDMRLPTCMSLSDLVIHS